MSEPTSCLFSDSPTLRGYSFFDVRWTCPFPTVWPAGAGVPWIRGEFLRDVKWASRLGCAWPTWVGARPEFQPQSHRDLEGVADRDLGIASHDESRRAASGTARRQ